MNSLDGWYYLTVNGDRYELKQGKTVIHVRPINGKKVSRGDKR